MKTNPDEHSGPTDCSLTSAQRAAYRESLTMPRWRQFHEIGLDHGCFLYSEPPYHEIHRTDFSPHVEGYSVPPEAVTEPPLVFPSGTLFYGPIEDPFYSDAAEAFI